MRVTFKFPVETLAGRTEPGGLVFSKWRTGIDVARRHVVPRNPQSTDQVLTRQAFTQSSQAYSLLTDEQRALWTTYAQAKPLLTNGYSVVLPEINLFNKVNSLRILAGEGVSNTAPVDFCNWSVLGITSATWDEGGPTLSIIYTHNNADPSTELVMAEICPALPSAMVRPADNDYRMLCGAKSDSFKTVTASPQTAVFGSPRFATWQEGDYAWIRLTPISKDGDIGTAFAKYQAISVV